MKNQNEQPWFDDVNRIDDDVIAKWMDEVHPSLSRLVPEEALHRVQHLTFEKLGLPLRSEEEHAQVPSHALAGLGGAPSPRGEKQTDRSRRTDKGRDRRWWAVALIGAAVVATVAITPNPVSAALQRMLDYIPGVGVVQQKNAGQGTYILQSPVSGSWNGQPITVSAIAVMPGSIEVRLGGSGPGISAPKEIQLVTASGATYGISSAMGLGNGSNWVSEYWRQGDVTPFTKATVVISGGNGATKIPVVLSLAKSAADLSQLGPTDTKNGVTMAIVPTQINGEERLTFASQFDGNYTISEYGPSMPDGSQSDIEVTDKSGSKYPVSQVFGMEANQYQFVAKQGVSSYHITVPQVSANYPGDATVRIPLPADQPETINKTVQIGNFPVLFTHVEWTDASRTKIRVYLNLNPESVNPSRELYAVQFDRMSWDGEIDSDTGALKWVEFAASPAQSAVTLHLRSPQVYIKGPWNFDVEVRQP